jgi:hypothetical protein
MTRSHYEQSLVDFNWRDEVKKLGLLIEYEADFRGVLDTKTILENLVAILAQKPIILEPKTQQVFNRWKDGPARLQ